MSSLVFFLKYPEYLIGLSLVPFLLVFYLGSLTWTKNKMKKFGEAPLIRRITPENSKTKQNMKFLLMISAYCLIILQISGPVISFRKEVRNPADIFFLVDVSNSMLARDISPSRLSFAKSLILDHKDLWVDARLGIIPFAGQSMITIPLTRNTRQFIQNLESLNPQSIPVQGTLISQAIELAEGSFSKNPDRSKLIVLLTDGENHEPAAHLIAGTLKAKNIHLIIIGIGTVQGTQIPIRSNGKLDKFLKDRNGNTVLTRLRPEVLDSLAHSGNGKFLEVSRSEKNILPFLQNILEENRKGYKDQIQNADFPVFMVLALILLIAEFLLSERKNLLLVKYFPGFKTLLLLVFLGMAGMVNPVKAQNATLREANRLYKMGKWTEAESLYLKGIDSTQKETNYKVYFNLGCALYQEKDWSGAKTYFQKVLIQENISRSMEASIWYNMGNTAFSEGNYEESIRYYIKCLQRDPKNPDALYNLAFARYKLKKNPPPPPSENQDQEIQKQKQVPDPAKTPQKRKPLKPHLEKNGNSKSGDSQNLEQNW